MLNYAIQQLPQHHRDCFNFLIFHLARVAERERENLVDIHTSPTQEILLLTVGPDDPFEPRRRFRTNDNAALVSRARDE